MTVRKTISQKIKNSPSLFSHIGLDFLSLYLPGVIAFFLIILFRGEQKQLLYTLFLAAVVIDSGHIYLTGFRYRVFNYLNSLKVLSAFTLIFSLMYLWSLFDYLYFFEFLFYLTLYHNVRQNEGILKWSFKTEGIYRKESLYFYTVLSWLPLLALHFREDLSSYFYLSYYSGLYETVFFPSSFIFKFLLLINVVLLIGFVLREIILWLRQRKFEKNRVLAVCFPVLIYYFIGYLSQNFIEALILLAVSHGISYAVLIGYSKSKTSLAFKASWKWYVVSFLFMGILGYLQMYLFDGVFLSEPKKLTGLLKFLFIFVHACLFSHYFFDGFLWKKAHHESGKVFN